LFEAVQGLDEEADMIWMLRVDEAGRLATVDTLGELAM
jgi:hypothetical protein